MYAPLKCLSIRPVIRPNGLVFLVTAGMVCIGLPIAAENMSLEQVQALRQDAQTAGEALDRVLQKTGTAEMRQDAGAARDALGRIITRLDAHLAQNSDLYGRGTKYPPAANVQIASFEVPVGVTVVHVPVTLDKASPNTVIAHVRVYDGDGGRADPDTTKAVIFRPGDPLQKTVSFAVRGMSAGNNVRAVQPSVPDGGERKGGGILITAKAGAVNEPITGGRAALTFQPLGTLCYEATGATLQFDDEGGSNRFSTALQHGRTQVGNGETGYYGPVDMGGFERTAEGLVLKSRRLDAPVKVGSPATEYPFLASMLSGHRTPETYFKHGSAAWVVKMPNRFGAWPALWLLPVAGWPPEIDVYEGFGYNGSWKFASDLSANLHGGDRRVRTFTRPAMSMHMGTFGLAKTLDTEFHTFAVTVEPAWITMFVDGAETMRYANPFQGETWYPLMNVAVKATPDDAYAKGSGAMILQSIKVWRVE